MNLKEIEDILNKTFRRDTNLYRALTNDRYVDPDDVEQINQFLNKNGPEFYIHWFSGQVIIDQNSIPDNFDPSKEEQPFFTLTYLIVGTERDFRNGDIISFDDPRNYGKFEIDPIIYPQIGDFLDNFIDEVQTVNAFFVFDNTEQQELLFVQFFMQDGQIVTISEQPNTWGYEEDFEPENSSMYSISFNGSVTEEQTFSGDLLNLSDDQKYDDGFETTAYTFSGFIDHQDEVSFTIYEVAFPDIYNIIKDNFPNIESIYLTSKFIRSFDAIKIKYLELTIYLSNGEEIKINEQLNEWPTTIH